MAFPKAKIKRFNEIMSCAPPVGHYDPKSTDRVPNVLLNMTDERFKQPSATLGPALSGKSFARFSVSPSTESLSSVQSGPSKSSGTPCIRELKKELRMVVRQRNELHQKLNEKDRELSHTKADLVKLLEEKLSVELGVCSLGEPNTEIDSTLNESLATELEVEDKDMGSRLHDNDQESPAFPRESSDAAVCTDLQMSDFDFCANEDGKETKIDFKSKIGCLEGSLMQINNVVQVMENRINDLTLEKEQLELKLQTKNALVDRYVVALSDMHLAANGILSNVNELKEEFQSLNSRLKLNSDCSPSGLANLCFPLYIAGEHEEENGEGETKILSDDDDDDHVVGDGEIDPETSTSVDDTGVPVGSTTSGMSPELGNLMNVGKYVKEIGVYFKDVTEAIRDIQTDVENVIREDKRTLADLEAQLSAESQHVIKLGNGRLELETIISYLQSDVDELNIEVEFRSKENRELSQASKRNDEIHSETIKSLEDALVQSKIAQLDLEEEVRRKDDIARDSEDRLREKNLEYLRLREQLSDSNDKNSTATAKLTTRIKELEYVSQVDRSRMEDLERNYSRSRESLADKEAVLERMERELQDVLKVVELMRPYEEDNLKLSSELNECREELLSVKAECNNTVELLKSVAADGEFRIGQMEEKLKVSNDVGLRIQHEHNRLFTEHHRLMTKFNDVCLVNQQFEEQVAELQHDAQSNEAGMKKELAEQKIECDKWRMLYEDLNGKVAPFKELLENYELEKQALLKRNVSAKKEVDKLSSDYAKLLGHQNHKQKIHHLSKIKDENLSLKEELEKLRIKEAMNRKRIEKLTEKVENLEGKRRFDPLEAFKFNVEGDERRMTMASFDMASVTNKENKSTLSNFVPSRNNQQTSGPDSYFLSVSNKKTPGDHRY